MARKQMGSLYRKTRTVNGKKVDSKCYYGSFTDPHSGKRIVKKLFTDKTASRRRLDQLIQQAEQKAAGIIDRYAEHRTRPIVEHISEYLDHCEHVGQAKRHRQVKQSDLERLIADTGAKRLPDLEAAVVERHLRGLREEGLSARKVNAVRSHAVAFMNWCVKTGRTPENRLSIISKLDERTDRRRVRRPLTDEELTRLLEVAEEQDLAIGNRYTSRKLVYLVAALTGLRRGELKKITWGDLDLETSVLRIRAGVGKSKREDYIALHPQALDALISFKPETARPADKVFATMPTIRTFYLDLERARAKWIEEAPDDAERQRRQQSDMLSRVDHQGRVVDLHAMRTTLGTMLAQQGVAPQLAQKIMRHADYKTTLNHYTVLGLHDTARAIESLPRIGKPDTDTEHDALAATGTDDMPGNHGREVVAPVVARNVHSMAFRGNERHSDNDDPKPAKHQQDGSQAPDLSTDCASRRRVSPGVRRKRAKGLEPSTFSLEG